MTECARCSKPIVQPETGRPRKFCSRKCAKSQRRFVPTQCQGCGTPIEPTQGRGRTRLYCGQRCREVYGRGSECNSCGQIRELTESGACETCSESLSEHLEYALSVVS